MHVHMYAAAAVIKSRAPALDASMTDRSATTRRVRSAASARALPAEHRSPGEAIADYVRRGPECAFANTRLLGRVITSVYDEALRPADLRASQLALMWAIVACEPVEMGRLGEITQTDQTTLSRTVENLRQSGLVAIERGDDRRVRGLRLSSKGRRQFARALPYWEEAQRRVDQWLSVEGLADFARKARRMAREGHA